LGGQGREGREKKRGNGTLTETETDAERQRRRRRKRRRRRRENVLESPSPYPWWCGGVHKIPHAHEGKCHDRRGDLVLVQGGQKTLPPKTHVTLYAQQVCRIATGEREGGREGGREEGREGGATRERLLWL